MFRKFVGLLFLIFSANLFLISHLSAQSHQKIPKGIAGFELNKDIREYSDRVRMEKGLVEIDYPYLTAYEILPFPGFRGGFLVVGNCTGSQKVLRIKLKYSNGTKKFFKRLKENIVRRFGDPIEYRGDPFHVFVAWKWRFVDSNGNAISLILQHYSGLDEEYAAGNSIKINFISGIKQERECYRKAREKSFSKRGIKKGKVPPLNIEYYLPY